MSLLNKQQLCAALSVSESTVTVAASQARAEEVRRQQAEQAMVEEARRLELQRENVLKDEATTWRHAEEIRAYMAHMRTVATVDDAGPTKELREWLEWAAEVANNMHPTTARKKM